VSFQPLGKTSLNQVSSTIPDKVLFQICDPLLDSIIPEIDGNAFRLKSINTMPIGFWNANSLVLRDFHRQMMAFTIRVLEKFSSVKGELLLYRGF
jgi:hypothetical protein